MSAYKSATSSETFFPARNPPPGCGAAGWRASAERGPSSHRAVYGAGALSPWHGGQRRGNQSNQSNHRNIAQQQRGWTQWRRPGHVTRDTWHVVPSVTVCSGVSGAGVTARCYTAPRSAGLVLGWCWAGLGWAGLVLGWWILSPPALQHRHL